ncbi:hypothetical protein DFJ58DRAFT_660332, partial [Suillus subalutaceus]|uniref:uncharacterized protein n=1 Tax=Suillus subalutaceus TaxID=48586 RepID=UPI001B87B7AD
GRSAQAYTHWAVPNICIQLDIVDCFPLHATSVMAAICLLRLLAGFGFPLFAPAMYSTLRFWKGDTIFAVAALLMGCSAYVSVLVPSLVTPAIHCTCNPWIFRRYGERIRNST